MKTLLARLSSSPGMHGIGTLLTHTGLLAAAEVVNRVTRILTVVVLARAMSVPEFGLAAAALTAHELTRVLIQNGLGTRIVAAADHEVERIAYGVHRLNWGLGATLTGVQLCAAWPIAVWFGSPSLGAAVAVLSVVHVIYPFAMVNVYLAQRSGSWRMISIAIAGSAVIDNVATAILALSGAGLWSVVAPKVAVALCWVVWHRHQRPWRPAEKLPLTGYRQLLGYASRVLGAEVLLGLRFHIDKIIIGWAFGPLQFAIYAFASNIGRGIALSVSTSLGALILPHLSRGRESGHLFTAYRQSLALAVVTTAPFAVGLAIAAPWIIPLVFGDKWAGAIEIVSILSVASVAHPIIVATSQLLRSVDRTGMDLAFAALITLATVGGLLIGIQFGIETAIILSAVGQVAVVLAALAVSVTFSRTAAPVTRPLEASI